MTRRLADTAMSKTAYALAEGTRCPFCARPQTERVGKFFEQHDGKVRVRVKCNDCYRHWYEIWVLKGYETI